MVAAIAHLRSKSLKSIKLNMVFNTIRTIAGLIFPLITFPYTSRILGPHGTGWMNFALSFAGYFAMFATIGIPGAGIREIAQSRDDKAELSARAQELFLMHLGASLVAFGIYACAVFLRADLTRELVLFMVAGLSIILSSLALDWLYQGMEDYAFITIRSLIFSSISLAALFMFVHKPEHYVICAGISVAASLGSAVLNFWNARSIIFRSRTSPWQFRRHLKSMASCYALSLVSSLYLSLDTVLLGFLSKPENVGFYAAASRFLGLTWSLIASFGSTLMPRLSYYSETGNESGFQSMIDKSIAMTVMLCLPAMAALMFLSEDIIRVFAGDAFLPAVACLNLTVPGLLFSSLANILAWQVLFPKKQDGKVLVSISLTAIVSVTTNLVLIREYAHVGAAVSKLIAEAIVCGALYVQARKCCEIRLFPWKSVRFYLLGTAAMMLALVAVRFLVDSTMIRLAVSVPLGGVVFFAVLVLSGDELARTATETLRKKVGLT